MQPLLPSLKTVLFAALLCPIAGLTLANETQESEEDSYLAEARQEAIEQAKKNLPHAPRADQDELLSDTDKEAFTKVSKEEISGIAKTKPTFSKPKLSAPQP